MTIRSAFLLPLLPFFAACDKAAEPVGGVPGMNTSANLELISRVVLDVKEPSDLCLSGDRKSLWTVSDENGEVYHLSLQGEILSHFHSGLEDLEGVAPVGDSEVALLSERGREITITNLDGKPSRSARFEMGGERNKGPEALAFNAADSLYYALKEKSPGTLITLDADLKEVERSELVFAKDYAAMCYEPERGHLWVLSDESGAIYVLDGNRKIQTVYSLDIAQPEGLAVDYAEKKLWVVCDRTSTLYTFRFADY